MILNPDRVQTVLAIAFELEPRAFFGDAKG
jgi:hypothetical protein